METFGIMAFQAKTIMTCGNGDVKARPRNHRNNRKQLSRMRGRRENSNISTERY